MTVQGLIAGLTRAVAAGALVWAVAACSDSDAGGDGRPASTGASADSGASDTRQERPAVLAPRFVDPTEFRLEAFDRTELVADMSLAGEGGDVDTIAFWEAPDPADTLMLVTAKESALVQVWRFPFESGEQPPLRHETFEDSFVNGVVVDQATDLMYVVVSEPSSAVSVFELPGLAFVDDLNDGRVPLASEPNIDLYLRDGAVPDLLVSADDVIHVMDAQTGEVSFSFGPGRDVETVLADEFWGRVHVPDEKGGTGVFVYDAQWQAVGGGGSLFGDGVFEADEEGGLLYEIRDEDGEDTGEGLIIVSDQRDDRTDFEVFDRTSWAHLGTFRVDGVKNTDGIASTQRALPGFPMGVFAAVDDDAAVAIVGWERLLVELGMVPPGG